RIDFQRGNGNTTRTIQRVVEKRKRMVGFTCPCVDLGELKRSLWSLESILRFGQKTDRAFAFSDSRFFFTEPCKNLTEQRMPEGIVRSFAQGSLCNRPRVFEGRSRLFLVIQKRVNRAFEKFLGLRVMNGKAWRYLIQKVKGLRKSSLEHPKLDPTVRDHALGIDTRWHMRQFFLHHRQVPFPIERKHRLCCASVDGVRCGLDGTIENPVCGFKVFIGAIVVGKIYKNKRVSWAERCRLFKIASG